MDPAGLHELASRCRIWSDGLAQPAVPVAPVPGFSTALAVTEAQSALDAVSAALAARMRQTAAALVEAADVYRATEEDSATALRHPAVES